MHHCSDTPWETFCPENFLPQIISFGFTQLNLAVLNFLCLSWVELSRLDFTWTCLTLVRPSFMKILFRFLLFAFSGKKVVEQDKERSLPSFACQCHVLSPTSQHSLFVLSDHHMMRKWWSIAWQEHPEVVLANASSISAGINESPQKPPPPNKSPPHTKTRSHPGKILYKHHDTSIHLDTPFHCMYLSCIVMISLHFA